MAVPSLSLLLEDNHLRTLLAYFVRVGYEVTSKGRSPQLDDRGLELLQAGCRRLLLVHDVAMTQAPEVFWRLTRYLFKRLSPTGELAAIDLRVALAGPLPD